MKAWILILAAGESIRFNGIKALAAWGEGTLLSNAYAVARTVTGDRILVAAGAHDVSPEQAVPPHLFAHNPGWRDGMGGTIAFGLAEILRRDPDADAVIILPVDQPLVTADHLHLILQTALEKKSCLFTTGDNRLIGPPAAIPRAFFDAALSLRGERGLKSVVEDYLTIENAGALLDADTPDALELLKQRVGAKPHG